MILQGDCLELMRDLPDNSITAIITDPPYELGFMGKGWDKSGIANNIDLWRECLRVLKPGGHLLSFGGTRTFHRMACAIEDAGFEIRDMVEWVYGSGFPKSHNIGIAVDKLQGNEREILGKKVRGNVEKAKETGSTFAIADANKNNKAIFGYGVETLTKGTSEWEGWGTAIKPSHEPICMARKPLSEKTVAENCLKWGTGGINIDESRVGVENRVNSPAGPRGRGSFGSGGVWERQVGSNTVQGRFPANLIHDGSEEVKACFPDTKSGKAGKDGHKRKESLNYQSTVNYADRSENAGELYGDSGNASRFFKSIIYISKAGKKDRGEGNTHPTVKPTALMEYLINMVSREGDTILDPFGGSGTTAIACLNTNRKFILMEKELEYIEIIKQRIKDWHRSRRKCEI